MEKAPDLPQLPPEIANIPKDLDDPAKRGEILYDIAAADAGLIDVMSETVLKVNRVRRDNEKAKKLTDAGDILVARLTALSERRGMLNSVYVLMNFMMIGLIAAAKYYDNKTGSHTTGPLIMGGIFSQVTWLVTRAVTGLQTKISRMQYEKLRKEVQAYLNAHEVATNSQ